MRPIHSLEDLKIAKKELAVKREISKREFANHIGTLRHDATGYILKKVVMPLGIGAVAALAIKFFFFDKNRNQQVEDNVTGQKKDTEEVKENVEKNTWLSYFSIILSIIKIYQSAVAQNKAEAAMEDDKVPSEADPAGPRTEEAEAAFTPEPPPTEEMEEEEEPEPLSPKSFVRQFQQQQEKATE